MFFQLLHIEHIELEPYESLFSPESEFCPRFSTKHGLGAMEVAGDAACLNERSITASQTFFKAAEAHSECFDVDPFLIFPDILNGKVLLVTARPPVLSSHGL